MSTWCVYETKCDLSETEVLRAWLPWQEMRRVAQMLKQISIVSTGMILVGEVSAPSSEASA